MSADSWIVAAHGLCRSDIYAPKIEIFKAKCKKGKSRIYDSEIVPMGLLPLFTAGSLYRGQERIGSIHDGNEPEFFEILDGERETKSYSECIRPIGQIANTMQSGRPNRFSELCQVVAIREQMRIEVVIPCTELLRFFYGSSSSFINCGIGGGLLSSDPDLKVFDERKTGFTSLNPKRFRMRQGRVLTRADTVGSVKIITNPLVFSAAQSIFEMTMSAGRSRPDASDGWAALLGLFPRGNSKITAFGRYFTQATGSLAFLVDRLNSFENFSEPFHIDYSNVSDGDESASENEEAESRHVRRLEDGDRRNVHFDESGELPQTPIDLSLYETTWANDPAYPCEREKRPVRGVQKKREDAEVTEGSDEVSTGEKSSEGKHSQAKLRRGPIELISGRSIEGFKNLVKGLCEKGCEMERVNLWEPASNQDGISIVKKQNGLFFLHASLKYGDVKFGLVDRRRNKAERYKYLLFIGCGGKFSVDSEKTIRSASMAVQRMSDIAESEEIPDVKPTAIFHDGFPLAKKKPDFGPYVMRHTTRILQWIEDNK